MVTIPELVGKKTKRKTTRGRDVYKTLRQIGPIPKGSSISELGVSIPLNKKKTRWLNAPSIYHGVQYTDDEILRFYKQGQLKPSEVEIIEGSAEDAVRASKKRSSKLLKRAEGGPPKPGKVKEPTGLSKILRGVSKVARNPLLTALQLALSPTPLDQPQEKEWLEKREVGSKELDFPESGLSSIHSQEDKITAFDESKLDQPESGLSSIPLPDLYHQPMYTGGPHEWEGDTFDLEKVGTGEGTAVEGWGAYGGEVEDTGEYYRILLSDKSWLYPYKTPSPTLLTFSEPRKNIMNEKAENMLLELESEIGEEWIKGKRAAKLSIEDKDDLFGQGKIEDTKAEKIREIIDQVIDREERRFERFRPSLGAANQAGVQKDKNKVRSKINFLRNIRGKVTGVEPFKAGTLYRTNLPKHIVDERFLDSDLLISEQSPYVQKALKTIVEKMGDKDLSQWFVSAMRDRPTPASTSDELALKSMWSGKSFYRELVETFTNPVIRFIEGSPRYRGRTAGTKRQASEALRDVGIPGLKYFDQLSRPDQAGTKNFVVWDQELLDAAPVLRLKATGGVVSKGGSVTVRNPYEYAPKAI